MLQKIKKWLLLTDTFTIPEVNSRILVGDNSEKASLHMFNHNCLLAPPCKLIGISNSIIVRIIFPNNDLVLNVIKEIAESYNEVSLINDNLIKYGVVGNMIFPPNDGSSS